MTTKDAKTRETEPDPSLHTLFSSTGMKLNVSSPMKRFLRGVGAMVVVFLCLVGCIAMIGGAQYYFCKQDNPKTTAERCFRNLKGP